MTETTATTANAKHERKRKSKAEPQPKRLPKRRLNLRPRFGSVDDAVHYGGVSRSKLYEEAAKHPGLFRKNGTATIVDFKVYDTILDGLPVAQIKPNHKLKAEI